MASFEEKKPEQGGNGLSSVEILKSLGLSFVASLLPLISERLVAWFAQRFPAAKPQITPDRKIVVEPVVHKPPTLPPLEKLPNGDG